MPLSSMTGFARTPFAVDEAKLVWELKSVNGRGLEVRLRLPPGYDHLEPGIRAMARETLARGSCFFSLQPEAGSERPRLALNEEALALVIAAARRLADIEGVGPPSADGLLSVPGVLREGGGALSEEAQERRDAAVMEALGTAIEALAASRREEGARLGAVVEDQMRAIAELVEQAEAISAEAPEALKARIAEQVALLTSDPSGLSPERLHQEAVIAATRADVREELDRLKSHIVAARQLLGASDPVGRKLEFLSQEFNREANTLCSKAFDRRLTAIGIELKAVIDQLREQVQNLA